MLNQHRLSLNVGLTLRETSVTILFYKMLYVFIQYVMFILYANNDP